ncbi:MAG: serine/threonine-protein kinase, partial [Myxococcota bacterium]
ELKQELIEYGPMDPGRTLALMQGVLGGLGHSHSIGIVHKDLKPSNLFLSRPNSPDESLIVMDFGIARVASMDSKTVTGNFVGTPRYYAPEYIREQVVTPALDVYQMGLILVEMLTGRPVVETNDPFQCIHDHCTGSLKLPPMLMAGPLGPILETALHLDYTRRFPNAYAFLDVLRGISPDTIDAGTESNPSGLVVRDPTGDPHTGLQSRPSSNQIFRSGHESEGPSISVPQVVRVGNLPTSVSQVQAHTNVRPEDAERPRLNPAISGGVQMLRPTDSELPRINPSTRANSVSMRAQSASVRVNSAPMQRVNSGSAPAMPRPNDQAAGGGLSSTNIAIAATVVLLLGVLLLGGLVVLWVVVKPGDKANGKASASMAQAPPSDDKGSDDKGASDPAAIHAEDKGDDGTTEEPKGDTQDKAAAVETTSPNDEDKPALCSSAEDIGDAKRVELQLESKPPGAPLFIEDQFLGITPCLWVKAKGDEPVKLHMRHPDVPKTVLLEMVPNQDQVFTVDLDKAEAVPDPKPATSSRRSDRGVGRRADKGKADKSSGKSGKAEAPPARDTATKVKKPVVIGRER